MKREDIKERIVLDTTLGKNFKLEHFKFDYDGNRITEAVNRLDKVMLDSMYKLKESMPSDFIYGLGLSGGLDSRIVLHYAKKVDMNVKCFIYGEPYPHKVFASRDYKNALIIGKKYGISKKDIAVLKPSKDVVSNFIYNCEKCPYRNIDPNDISGVRRNKYPIINLLLTGRVGGESMGSCIPLKPISDITEYIFKRLSRLTPIKDGKTYTEIEGIISKDDFQNMHCKLDNVFSKYDNDYVSAIYSYLYSKLLFNHYPLGLDRKHRLFPFSFSPFFTSEYIDEMHYWNPEWIKNHVIQKEFHKYVIPDLCNITNQRWMIPFKYQDDWRKIPMKYIHMGMFLLRWHGLRYYKWLNRLLQSEFARQVMDKPNDAFDDLFDDGKKALDLPKNLSILGGNVLKVKYLMDNDLSAKINKK